MNLGRKVSRRRPSHTKAASSGVSRMPLFLALLAAAVIALGCIWLIASPHLKAYMYRQAVHECFVIEGAAWTGKVDALGANGVAYLDSNMPYEPSPAQIDQLPEAEGIVCFSMNPDTRMAPSLSAEESAAIEGALSYFTDRGVTCGFLAVDLGTGHAVGYEYDALVYGASAFKGIVAAYVCEEMIDNGPYELGGSLQRLMEASVVYSDNDAYRSLKNAYATGLGAWVADMGVDPSHVSRFRFPTYSAQESTALWAHIASYLDGQSDTALWLAEQLGSTNVSHIRAAVERGVADSSLNSSSEWRVLNKAGWISGSPNSTTDAGLVYLNGHVYAISVMTNAPDSAASREAATQLALEILRAMQ